MVIKYFAGMLAFASFLICNTYAANSLMSFDKSASGAVQTNNSASAPILRALMTLPGTQDELESPLIKLYATHSLLTSPENNGNFLSSLLYTQKFSENNFPVIDNGIFEKTEKSNNELPEVINNVPADDAVSSGNSENDTAVQEIFSDPVSQQESSSEIGLSSEVPDGMPNFRTESSAESSLTPVTTEISVPENTSSNQPEDDLLTAPEFSAGLVTPESVLPQNEELLQVADIPTENLLVLNEEALLQEDNAANISEIPAESVTEAYSAETEPVRQDEFFSDTGVGIDVSGNISGEGQGGIAEVSSSVNQNIDNEVLFE